jgi:hypothetical protein
VVHAALPSEPREYTAINTPDRPAWAWWLLASGVAGVATGAVVGVVASQDETLLKQAQATKDVNGVVVGVTYASQNDIAGSIETRYVVAVGAVGAGAVLGAIGIWGLARGPGRVTWAPAVDGHGLALAGRF